MEKVWSYCWHVYVDNTLPSERDIKKFFFFVLGEGPSKEHITDSVGAAEIKKLPLVMQIHNFA